jgi:hypothetical protein
MLVVRRMSQEELQGKLQAFPDTYESFMGEPLDYEVLKGYLAEQLVIKKRQFIDQAFSNMSVVDLKILLNHLSKQLEPKPVIDNNSQLSKKKGKK